MITARKLGTPISVVMSSSSRRIPARSMRSTMISSTGRRMQSINPRAAQLLIWAQLRQRPGVAFDQFAKPVKHGFCRPVSRGEAIARLLETDGRTPDGRGRRAARVRRDRTAGDDVQAFAPGNWLGTNLEERSAPPNRGRSSARAQPSYRPEWQSQDRSAGFLQRVSQRPPSPPRSLPPLRRCPSPGRRKACGCWVAWQRLRDLKKV